MAIEGTQKYDKAQTDEMNMLNDIDAMVKETVKNLEEGKVTNPDDPTPPKPTQPDWVSDDVKEVKVKDETGNDISIPKPDDSTILNPDATVDEGIVMKDSKDNEWVWVPVDEATYNSMFVTETKALAGSTGVTTAKYSASNIISGIPRVKPCDALGYREPDLVLGAGGQYDYMYYSTANFSNLNDMATKLVSDYNKMADSIKKYSGFYIGRYELSNSGVKAGGSPIVGIDWYQLYKQCKELTVDETKCMVRMIWRMPMGRNM